MQRAGGFIEGDTEPGEGSCRQPDHGLPSPPHCQGLLDTPSVSLPALDNTKGILPQTHQRCPRGPPEFCSGVGRGGDKRQRPLRASHGQSHHTVHPSLHQPACLYLSRPPSLAALEPGSWCFSSVSRGMKVSLWDSFSRLLNSESSFPAGSGGGRWSGHREGPLPLALTSRCRS